MRAASATPPRWVRLALVIVVAGAVGAFTHLITDPPLFPSDFQFYWRGTRLWLAGVDPYAMRPHTAMWPLWDRLFYPLPALVILSPLASLPQYVAHVSFVTGAAAILAWRLTRDALWPLLLFATPSFVIVMLIGQWSPWLVVGALLPWAGFLLAAKPTLGLACFCYRPTWRAIASGLAITLVSLALMPSWPVEWLDNLHEVARHPAPITHRWGPLLVLSALRWRTREGRFLLAMACVPQLLFFADQLPLFLVARTKREAALFVGWGMAVMAVYLAPLFGGPGQVGLAQPWAMVACYLPALAIVLRRPNEGPLPTWLEHRVSVLPAWLRGRSPSAERASLQPGSREEWSRA